MKYKAWAENKWGVVVPLGDLVDTIEEARALAAGHGLGRGIKLNWGIPNLVGIQRARGYRGVTYFVGPHLGAEE